ncbi:NAD(P)H nitroreductase [Vibrio parahaemolyticus]|uniref:NAD(P)H nitroreductase n=1 Tax=Vibrio mediterranei TaxID=689 RepID=UPI004067E5F9
MDALELLLNRRSIAKLSAPAPEGQALENIIKAGLRAPDHAGLTPWQFVLAQGDGRQKLSNILSEAATRAGSDEAVIEKARKAPFRAPLVITIIAKVTPHDKVPAFEQHLSAGCAVQAMQMAAVAQGYQAFWRSGKWMFDDHVRTAFGVEGDDQIVGFLYVGTPGCTPMKVPERELSKFVEFL